MKKQLLLIGLSVAIVTSSVASTKPLPGFIFNKLIPPKSDDKKTISSHHGYANFTGKWIGACDSEPDEETSMVIEQSADASSIVIDDVTIAIDAIATQGVKENFKTEHTMLHTRWSNDGQQLLSSGIFYTKKDNMSQGGLIASVLNYSMARENEQLIITTTYSVFLDGNLGLNDTDRCVYKKL